MTGCSSWSPSSCDWDKILIRPGFFKSVLNFQKHSCLAYSLILSPIIVPNCSPRWLPPNPKASWTEYQGCSHIRRQNLVELLLKKDGSSSFCHPYPSTPSLRWEKIGGDFCFHPRRQGDMNMSTMFLNIIIGKYTGCYMHWVNWRRALYGKFT